MTQEKKRDYADKFIAINHELQVLTDDLDENKKQTKELLEVEELTHQVYKEKIDIFDELTYYWKGDKANRFLHKAYEDNEYEYKQSMRNFDEVHSDLEQKQKQLLEKEEALLNQQLKLKQSSH